MAEANDSGSRSFTNRPFFPSSTASEIPPRAIAVTGKPCAITEKQSARCPALLLCRESKQIECRVECVDVLDESREVDRVNHAMLAHQCGELSAARPIPC